MLSDNLNSAIFLMLVLGTTFPGKNIVGLSYLLEFTPESKREKTIPTIFISGNVAYFMLIYYY